MSTDRNENDPSIKPLGPESFQGDFGLMETYDHYFKSSQGGISGKSLRGVISNNLIDFVEKILGIAYPESADMLRSNLGYSVERREGEWDFWYDIDDYGQDLYKRSRQEGFWFEGKGSTNFENWLLHPEGRRFPMVSGTYKSFAAACQDPEQPVLQLLQFIVLQLPQQDPEEACLNFVKIFLIGILKDLRNIDLSIFSITEVQQLQLTDVLCDSTTKWPEGFHERGACDSMEDRVLDNRESIDSEQECGVSMPTAMVRITAGEFMMGALADDEYASDNEKPRHNVTLDKDFMIGKYAVTQALWESVMGSNPSYFKGANRPVEMVSWFDAVEFCNKLSKKEGFSVVYEGLSSYQMGDDQNMDKDAIVALAAGITCNWNAEGYRLPTEAEWEYSARGGEYHKYSGSSNVDEVAWYQNNSCTDNCFQTHPVGQRKPNGFGLYDMSGNVWEWCWDCWGDDYSIENPTGFSRINRGGDWRGSPKNVRTSNRFPNAPTRRSNGLGFRIVRSL